MNAWLLLQTEQRRRVPAAGARRGGDGRVAGGAARAHGGAGAAQPHAARARQHRAQATLLLHAQEEVSTYTPTHPYTLSSGAQFLPQAHD